MYMEQEPSLAGFYLLYAFAAVIVLVATLHVRMAAGAPLVELVRTRGYELPPVRLLIHTVHLSLWLATVYAAIQVLRYGWTYFEVKEGPYAWTALAALAAACGTGVLAWKVLTGLVHIDHNDPPLVAVAGIERTEGIDRDSLSKLGVEQFPQMLAYGGSAELRWRYGLIGAGIAVLAILLVAASEWGVEHGLYDAGNFVIELFLGALGLFPPLPIWLSDAMLVSAGLGCALLAGSNGTYTLMRFRQTLLTGLGLLAVLWWSRAHVDGGRAALEITGIVWLVFSIRWGYDLYRASRFRAVQEVSQPIAHEIGRAFPFLGSLRERPDCSLPVMDETALGTRISRGCRNVEEASPLVTRNLGRFMDLLRIEHEHFTAGMLRYLTVRRYLTVSNGTGTTRPLQDPDVPIWNEFFFPLRPPVGFRTLLDPLQLGSEWDVVAICGGCSGSGRQRCSGCGGSGRRQESQSYSESSGGRTVMKTRTVTVICAGCGGSGQVTCGSCGGAGRLVYRRTLNTQWQRMMPACTAPHTLLPEFMEDAEERTYFRLPLVENRTTLPFRPEHDGIDPDLETRLVAAAEMLRPSLPGLTSRVEELHDGILYRSDLQITGFQVLRIAFQRLPGKVGWFFGARPEFYFPALPISWSMVCTVLFVVPFVLLTVLFGFAIAGAVLQRILPGIY